MTPAPSALVVDDEPRLRDGLLALLRESGRTWARLEAAGDAEEALALVAEQVPDLAFLDIRMPGISGLELAARLPATTRVIFVTAFDAHTLEAFEAGAVDYLLKPVTPERLGKCLDRLQARAALDLEALRARLGASAPPPVEPLQWIRATSGKRTHLISVEDVRCFQAEEKLTRVDTEEGTHYIDTPLKALAARLDPGRFRQVHRSAIVALRAIAWVERREGEGGLLHLKGGATLPVSATHLKALKGGGA
ncbi:MAG TPA: LytTR family DNA-binding domain-containing protein [Holophagaceae bacterium]|nr:LytTR family DNA-binding domain-containing protein [Holophagaceae bacterium]